MSKKKDAKVKTALKVQQETVAHLEQLRVTPIVAASAKRFLDGLRKSALNS